MDDLKVNEILLLSPTDRYSFFKNSPSSSFADFHRITMIREIDRIFNSGDGELIEALRASVYKMATMFNETPEEIEASKIIYSHFLSREFQRHQ